MAKGQMRTSKETKKPKAEKGAKTSVSAYKASQGKGGSTMMAPPNKKG